MNPELQQTVIVPETAQSLYGRGASGVARAKQVVIGAIFRRGDKKGIDDLLRAFTAVREVDRAVFLLLAVTEEDREVSARLASEFGISDAVRVSQPQDNVAAQVAEFDVFALPSYEDAVPVALLEAMAAGIPVVACATPWLRTTVAHNVTGYLVDKGDVEALASCIALLVADAPHRQAVGSRAQARAKEMFRGTLFAGRHVYGYQAGATPSTSRVKAKQVLSALLPSRALVWRGNRDRAQFALTFDDAPDPIYTPQILEILHSHHILATFFVVGNRVEEHRNLVYRILEEGHEIANHSYTHRSLQHCSTRIAMAEVRRTSEVLESIVGERCRLFRPPFGRISRQCLVAAWAQRNAVVMWSVDPQDYCAKSPHEITEKLAERDIEDGDIILYHGTNEAAIVALPDVIAAATKSGRVGAIISDLIAGSTACS